MSIRRITSIAALALATAMAAACTSHGAAPATQAGETHTVPTGGAGAITNVSGATAATAPGGTAGTAGTPGTAGPGGTAPPAPTGDGTWHPVVHRQADTSPIPPMAQRLFAGLTVVSVSAAASSVLVTYRYTVTVSGSCSSAAATIAKTAKAQGMAVLANGSVTGPTMSGGKMSAGWMFVSNGPADGADLSLLAGTSPHTCVISGLSLSPVLLTMTGPLAGTTSAFPAVSCAEPVPGTLMVVIFAMPLDKKHRTLSVMFTGTGKGGPGTYSTGSTPGAGGTGGTAGQQSGDSEEHAFYTTTPLYSYAQMAVGAMAAQAKSAGSDDGSGSGDSSLAALPPGSHLMKGTVTMSPGMGAGRLDLSGDGEHLTGTFDCGMPVDG